MNNIYVGWRQVRIFTSDFSDQWYFGLLAAFGIPFAAKYPETPFWFSRYTGNRTNPSDDTADTEISKLQDPYLNAAQEHRSLRFRFCASSDEEAFLEALFTAKFWHSGFLPFNALKQFSEGRFGSATDVPRRLKRTNAVARLLHANCLFVLDVLQDHSGTWRFESNGDHLNRFSQNPFQTVIHLLSQVTGPDGHTPLPLYWIDPSTNQRILTATT
jgi:hypothetical protein